MPDFNTGFRLSKGRHGFRKRDGTANESGKEAIHRDIRALKIAGSALGFLILRKSWEGMNNQERTYIASVIRERLTNFGIYRDSDDEYLRIIVNAISRSRPFYTEGELLGGADMFIRAMGDVGKRGGIKLKVFGHKGQPQVPNERRPPRPPNQVPPNQVPPNQVPPNQIPTNQIPPNQIPPNQIPPNQIPPNQVPPNQVPPNQPPPNQVPPVISSIWGRVLYISPALFQRRGVELDRGIPGGGTIGGAHPNRQERMPVPGAIVYISGPTELQRELKVMAQIRDQTYSDQNGMFEFFDLQEGEYTIWAEHWGEVEPGVHMPTVGLPRVPQGGFYRSIIKKLTIRERGEDIDVEETDASGNKKKYKIRSTGRVHIDLELEPRSSTKYTAPLDSKGLKGRRAALAARERFDQFNRQYRNMNPAGLTAELNNLCADPGVWGRRARTLRRGFEELERRGNPNRYKWLRDRLMRHQMWKMEEESGGKIEFGKLGERLESEREGKLREQGKDLYEVKEGRGRGRTFGLGGQHLFSRDSYSDPNAITTKFVKAGVSMVIGMMLAAVGGNAFIFFGALLIGVSNLLPNPMDLKAVVEHINKLKKDADTDMATARTEEEKKTIQMRLSNNIMLTRTTLDAILGSGGGIGNDVGTIIFTKELFRILGFGIISAGFLLSSVPFAKPAGIVIALMGYFSLTYQTEKEDGHSGATLRSIRWRKKASM